MATTVDDGLRRAQARTTRLGAALVVASGLLLLELLPTLAPTPSPLRVDWWVLALGFALAELAVFHIEINHEAHTFSLSEVPTVIGLLFAGPAALVVGRLVGEAATLVLRDRQPIPKLLFNLSMFLGECTVALATYHALQGGRPVTAAGTWVAAAAALLAADTLSICCVLLAIRWHGAVPEPKRLFGVGAVTAVVNTAIAIAASLLLVVNLAAGVVLAVLVVVAYLTYRSYATLTQRHADLRMLYEFTTVVSRTANAEQVLKEMLDQAQTLLRADYAEIETDGPDGTTQLVALGVAPSTTVRPDDGLREQVVRTRRPLLVTRGERDEGLRASAAERGCKDLMIAPLVGDERVVATILVANRRGEVSSFDGEDLRLLQTFANHASVALENGRLIDRLSAEVQEREHQATHDALTGLPNRTLFYRRLREAVDAGAGEPSGFSVMLMDLDRFKEVNDTLGHHAGDLLLGEVARRLQAALPPGVTIARLGGDEFAMLLPSCAGADDARTVARHLLDYLTQPCYLDGVVVDVGASIGIAVFPDHGRDHSTLLKRSDVAMYEAKVSESHVAVYDAGGDAHSTRRLVLTSGLREAVEKGGLAVHYQPKVRLDTSIVSGVEALVRWRHPELGDIGPDEFIPIAEQTGMIVPLTAFVLRQALEDVARWRAAGHDVGVAVNAAVRSFATGDIVELVERLLAETATPADRLTLEVTETGMMTDTGQTVRTMQALADLGVRLSIDDFGTGYSSLAYLQKLPVHEVKIDRSFVMSMADDADRSAIVRSVVDLGRHLRLDVVAEGIEDEATLDQLRWLGCAYGQGYGISRPLPAAELGAWLTAREPVAAPV